MSRLDLGLRPDVSEIPAAVEDAEWFAAELDRHEMVDGEVPPALVREAVLAEHGGSIPEPLGVVAVSGGSSVAVSANGGAVAGDDGAGRDGSIRELVGSGRPKVGNEDRGEGDADERESASCSALSRRRRQQLIHGSLAEVGDRRNERLPVLAALRSTPRRVAPSLPRSPTSSRDGPISSRRHRRQRGPSPECHSRPTRSPSSPKRL